MIPYEQMVKNFMISFDQRRYNNLNETPDKVLKLRASLIEEESKEFIESKTRIEQLDALCDIIYVVAGTAVATGLRLLAISPFHKRTTLSKLVPLAAELRRHLPCAKRIQSLMAESVLECREIATTIGFSLDEAFEVVHENNMSKLWKEKPSDTTLIAVQKGTKFLVKNKEGKVIKPMGHKPPNLEKFV